MPLIGRSRRFTIFLNIYFVVVFVGIGGLQMYHVDAGLLTDYGADLLAPPWMYLSLRGRPRRASRLKRVLGLWRPLRRLIFVLAGCFVWEWLQRYDFSGTPLAITRGRFDPFDLLAYTLGLVVTYVAEVRMCRSRAAQSQRLGE
jgi:hypothetical protein